MNIIEKARRERIAVAIDRDKGSQYALRWVVDHIISRGQPINLVHVQTKPSSSPTACNVSAVNENFGKAYEEQIRNEANEVFLPFRCLCSRKSIKCIETVLEDTNIAKALIDFVSSSCIETLVLGAPSRCRFVRRFRAADVSSNVSRGVPDYCSVYVVGKGKASCIQSASVLPPTRSAPSLSLHRQPIDILEPKKAFSSPVHNLGYRDEPDSTSYSPCNLQEDLEMRSISTRSPVNYEPSIPNSDISFVSSQRPSKDHKFLSLYDFLVCRSPPVSTSSEYENRSYTSPYLGNRSMDFCLHNMSTHQAHRKENVQDEMRRLRLELKQTMDMYSVACKEAITARQKTKELQQQKIEEARLAKEAALSQAENEKTKYKEAIVTAQAAQQIAGLVAHKRINAEMKDRKGADEKKFAINSLGHDLRYRRYTIEEIQTATDFFSSSRKIGEGGYGPVYKCNLDHTQAAIKVLRPDAAQGQSQFQQEVEVLSCIRHPHMVLLLGACPEYCCLVYEYMANGSLDDRLFRRNNTPVIPWQVRFRIAAEIATALLFLHQTKPEPLVHRDLKPANILLDHNYVSKISDVGLARLVPPTVANSVTQYRMTSTAGTFCYIDPEYQQTGMLGIKSDIYSLGILLLQLVTAKPPMGLSHQVEHAIESGTFAEILDPGVPEWPIEEALTFAKLCLKCSEMRRKDRPDLGKAVLPELNRLRDFAEENMLLMTPCGGEGPQ